MQNELAEVRTELKTVKASMRSQTAYLGMSGQQLQEYFLQLNQKEILLLKRRADGEGSTGGLTNGYLQAPPRPMQGPPPAFDRNNLQAVVEHMHICEADEQESAKAVRALSSLAYSSTAAVVADARALPQVLRLMALHPENDTVQFSACGVVCNMAFDTNAALDVLSKPPVLFALVKAMGRSDKPKIVNKASEALARIIGIGAADATAENVATVEMAAAQLTKLFSAIVASGDASSGQNLMKICEQLQANEVVDFASIGRSTMASLEQQGQPPSLACATTWLDLTKSLSGDKTQRSEQQNALVEAGAIGKAVELMGLFQQQEAVQLCAIECVSTLVGVSWDALEAFAKTGGARQIETSLKEHIGNPMVQMKGLKALSSGVSWPQGVQVKSGFSPYNTVISAKAAMSHHMSNDELLIVGLESLLKCVENIPASKQEVKNDGGDELLRSVMEKHPSVDRIQRAGKRLQDLLKA